MKLSNKQKQDLETVRYFIPSDWQDIEITDKDIEDFFNYSDRGIKLERPNYFNNKAEVTGYDALLQGKRWRGIHVHEMYEPAILNGGLCYMDIIGWLDKEIAPRVVIDFLKKEMFQGIDAETIENAYQYALEYRTWWRERLIQFNHSKLRSKLWRIKNAWNNFTA